MSPKMQPRRSILLLLFSLTAFTSCGRSSPVTKVLRVGFVPAENAQEVIQNAQPIVEILQKELAMDVQPFVATDYTGVVEALRANKLDIAFLTPASYVLAKNEADVTVLLKSERKGSPFYYAAIITRADSGIKKLEDVKKIRAIALSEPIPADNLVMNARLDETMAKKVQTVFLDLSRDPKGKQMLRDLYQIDGFVPATDSDYDSVRQAFQV